jgi:putative peptide zinc metalloprotease protein
MASVQASDPAPGRQEVVVFCPARDRYVRIQGPQWAFLRSLDGQRTIAELERDFFGRLPEGMVVPLLARFAELGLLEGSAPGGEERTARRLRVTQLGAIQLSLVNPDRLLDRFVPLIRALGGPAGRTVSALVVLLGLYSTAVHADLVALASERLADPAWLASLAAALVVCVMLHELGHAAAVKYFGGNVRRMGLMLFYLVPAMFCDTNDAWRFPRTHQRAVVAAAGIWVQMVVAGFAQIALWLPMRLDVAVWLWSFALLNISLCLVNLIPFVKLDGYWVLVALTDVPNLRSRALAYLRANVLRLVAGIKRPQPPLAHPVLTMVFGLGCMLFPPVLVGIILLDYQHALLGLGRIGAAAWLFLAGSVVAVPRNGLVRIVRAARGWPRRARWRAGLFGGAGLLTVAGALAAVRVPLTVAGRFEVSDAGEVIAVLPATAHAYLGAGDRVLLRGRSTPGTTPMAEGVLTRDRQHDDQEYDGHEVRYRVVLDRGQTAMPRSATGLLAVRAEKVAPLTWFWSVYLQPVRSTLKGR